MKHLKMILLLILILETEMKKLVEKQGWEKDIFEKLDW